MATIKHISSKNADYGAAEQYLTFEHDEFTMKPVKDKDGRMVPREDYRIDTVNCGGEDFAVACLRANMEYKKNSQRNDVKSHHYIISFDPRDAVDNGLTVDKAQELGMEYCRKHFPGHQALVCTHPDGHNHSGNIHVHIVINSLRIQEVERKAYMDRPCDTQAGTKHRCTASAMRYFRSEVMEMCQREGLYQIDLLNGGKEKVTEREYWAKKRGQAEKDILVQKIIADGLTPRTTKFETDKERLRQSIRSVLSEAVSFEDFSARLMQDYGIAVRESRGRYSYLTPDRTKPITARKLGTDFDKAAVLSVIAENASKTAVKDDYGKNCKKERIGNQNQLKTPNTAIKQEPSIKQDGIQRMVDIQAKISEGKGKGYEWWAKGFNLQQMSKTMIYFEEQGFSSLEDVDAAIEESCGRQGELSKELKAIEKKISDNKELMRQASAYRRSKQAYDGLKKARNKERYREKNQADLTLFETAGRYFKERGITKFPDMAKIQEENESLLSQKNAVYSQLRKQKTKTTELHRVKSNIDVMLGRETKPEDGRNNREEKQEENMQFTKSELEMIYKYAATTKEETVRAMKDTLVTTEDTLTYVTIRNAAEKLEKLPEPECSRFIAENKAHHIEKSVRPSVLRRLAKAKEHVKQPILQGHDLAGMERFQSDTRHMVVMDVLNNDSPVGFKGERYRFFLSDEGYRNARASEKRGEIKIQSHAAVSEGKIYPDKRRNMKDNGSGIKAENQKKLQENLPSNPTEEQSIGYVGADTHLPSYLPYPRFLLKMEMTQTAKLLYALLLDRTTLSQKNGWQDECGRTYIIFTVTAIADALDKSPSTIKESLNELDRAGLLERKRQGFSAANRLYVKLPPEVQISGLMESENPYLISPKNRTTDGQKTGLMKSGKLASNNYNINKTIENQTMGVNKGRTAYGRYGNILLSEEEYGELVKEYPDRLQRFIEEMSQYLAAIGKSYSNYAAAIRMWAGNDRKGAAAGGRIPDYGYKEGESL